MYYIVPNGIIINNNISFLIFSYILSVPIISIIYNTIIIYNNITDI